MTTDQMAVTVQGVIHDAICDALPEWIKWKRLPRWRGDYAEAHAKVATQAVLDALEQAHYEVRYVGPGVSVCPEHGCRTEE